MAVSPVRRMIIAVAGLFLFVPSMSPANRPLPEDVIVKGLMQRAPGRLELLVRLPLAAVKDIQFPTRGETGYLDLDAIKSMLPGAAKYWIAGCFELREDGVEDHAPEILQTRVSTSSDPSFRSYQQALAHFDVSDLPPDTEVSPDQMWFDIHFRFTTRSDRSVVELRTKLADLGVRVETDLKYAGLNGEFRDFSFEGDPGLIYLNARPQDALTQFLQSGFRFILTSTDFLIFLLCLALPLRHYRDAFPVVAAFAAALSVTLLACAFGMAPDTLWLRPLIETLSAILILLAAFANIIGNVTPRRRTLFALSAGFVYAFISLFDFSAKAQFGGEHRAISAFSYDIGAVFAMSILVALLVVLSSWMFKFARAARLEMIIVSALAADTAWGWLAERWGRLKMIPIHVVFDASLLALVLRCLSILVLFGGLLWLTDEWLKSRYFPPAEMCPKDKQETAI
ncbi:MAG TPA: HupE/UreJ family protein [Bryobacteraceae bacterium]|nr:HupE/UreJ family protein [Bryobacteraceae bacterium]